MAATPDPIYGHPATQGLDPMFMNTTALVGWLEYLAHPEEHDGPRLIGTPGGSLNDGEVINVREVPRKTLDMQIGVDVDAGSVLRDLAIEDFFYAADVLSGQRINEMESMVNVIEEVRHRKDGPGGDYDDSTAVFGMLDTYQQKIFEGWNDDAGRAAFNAFGLMKEWYKSRTEALFKMSTSLVEFAAVIDTARKNLDKLMGQLIDALARWSEQRGGGGNDGALKFIGAAVGFALGKLDPTGISGVAFSLLFDKATEAAEAENDTATGEVGGETCYEILESYLRAAKNVCEAASAAVDEIIERGGGRGAWDTSLANVRDGMYAPPVLARG